MAPIAVTAEQTMRSLECAVELYCSQDPRNLHIMQAILCEIQEKLEDLVGVASTPAYAGYFIAVLRTLWNKDHDV